MGGIGESLKSTREAKGISLSQAEEDTKIRKRYLQALEEGDYDVIPGRVYAKGFLRNYANYLGLNQEEIMIEYKLLSMPVKEDYKRNDVEATLHKRRSSLRSNSRSDQRTYLLKVLIAVFAIVVLAVYNFVYKSTPKNELNSTDGPPATEQTDNKKPAKEPAKPAPDSKPQQQPINNGAVDQASPGTTGSQNNVDGLDPSAAQTTGLNVTLKGKDQVCWARVTVDGVVKFAGNINPGESKTFTGSGKIKLRLGNAGAVEVVMNGQSLGSLGPLGGIATREFTAGIQSGIGGQTTSP